MQEMTGAEPPVAILLTIVETEYKQYMSKILQCKFIKNQILICYEQVQSRADQTV